MCHVLVTTDEVAKQGEAVPAELRAWGTVGETSFSDITHLVLFSEAVNWGKAHGEQGK